jgi:hypothetical protein
MDYAELCVAGDNRTDELRLLGNGVVPTTAELAYRTLARELVESTDNFSADKRSANLSIQNHVIPSIRF